MSTKKNILQSLFGLFIGAIFLFITLKNKSLADIIQSIKEARLVWIIFSAITLLAVFMLRALRWRILLENIGYHPKKRSVIYALTIGYFMNSFTPKFGEIARCTSLSNMNKIPVSYSLGTVVSERIYDLLVMGLGVIILVIIEINRLGRLFSGFSSSIFVYLNNHILIALLLFIGLILIVFLVWKLFQATDLFIRIRQFMAEIISTIKLTFKLQKFKYFIILTILIWSFLVLLNYLFLQSLPGTEEHSFYFAAVVLFIGAIGWAIPTPGGIGTTHFVILQLFIAFNLSETDGIAFGILSNGLTFILTLMFGLIAIILKNTLLKNVLLPTEISSNS